MKPTDRKKCCKCDELAEVKVKFMKMEFLSCKPHAKEMEQKIKKEKNIIVRKMFKIEDLK